MRMFQSTASSFLGLISLAAIPAVVALSLTGLAPAAQAQEPEPIRTLILTGHNNHNWKFTSRLYKETLEATGRFAVEIIDDPAKALADSASISEVQLFFLDYNDYHQPRRWGDAAEKNFLEAVTQGAGVVSVHSANNAFKGWVEYETMLGLLWREGTGHGPFHRFDITFTDRDHPITRGLPDITDHPDELYHALVNPQRVRYHRLASAHAALDRGGTGKDEPMALTLTYGKGRVFSTPLGHVWEGGGAQKFSVCNPAFKILVARGSEWAATGMVTLPVTWSDVRTHNTLTAQEKAQGWKLLFDGKSTEHFRGFRKEAFPDRGWTIREDTLTHVKSGSGGDICTKEMYGDFEFVCEWRVEAGGNSGIMYRCSEEHQYPWQTGPEMQILDDLGHADGRNAKTRAGTMYDLFPCSADVSRPAGEWNTARIIAKGSRIIHELNGIVVVDIDLTSDEYKKAHAASKWPGMPHFATLSQGHICLQDHGDDVSFRNIKVLRLD
jgi:type 1 glutamine amidotransferase